MEDYYLPGEDSYVLHDFLLEEDIQNKVVLDLGSSTGYLCEALRNRNNFIITSDINYKALENNCEIDRIQTNLLNGIDQSKIDVIIFNPPYVPLSLEFGNCDGSKLNYHNRENFIEDKERITGGNAEGNEIILKFIDSLKTDAIIYLLIIAANNPDVILSNIKTNKLKPKLMKVKKVQEETIIILKFSK